MTSVNNAVAGGQHGEQKEVKCDTVPMLKWASRVGARRVLNEKEHDLHADCVRFLHEYVAPEMDHGDTASIADLLAYWEQMIEKGA